MILDVWLEGLIAVFAVVLFCLVLVLNVDSERTGRGYDYGNVTAAYYDDIMYTADDTERTERTVPDGNTLAPPPTMDHPHKFSGVVGPNV